MESKNKDERTKEIRADALNKCAEDIGKKWKVRPQSAANYIDANPKDSIGSEVFEGNKTYFIAIKGIKTDLYRYKQGIWVSDGEPHVKALVRELFPEHYTEHLANAIIDYIKAKNFSPISTFTENKHMQDYINLNNGVYDIKNKELIPHSPDFHFLYKLPINYKAWADIDRPDKILQFLQEIFADDLTKAISYLEWVAYTLMPDYPIQKGYLGVGKGANGKSTSFNVIERFLGTKNYSSLTLQQLTDSPFLRHNLIGKLGNICADIPSDEPRQYETFKQLTGEDTLTADKKFKEALAFKNSAKLFFSANELPPAYDQGYAYFRRWAVLEYNQRFEGSGADKELIDKLTTPEELSKLFGLVIKVFYPRIKAKMDFTYNNNVKSTTHMYKLHSSPAEIFIEERIIKDPDVFVYQGIVKEELQKEIAKFCVDRDLTQPSPKAITISMNNKGYPLLKTTEAGKTYYYYSRARLKDVDTTAKQPIISAATKSLSQIIDAYAQDKA